MAQSPYISQDLKDYLKTHKIEPTLSNVVNELLRKQYDDPYSYMMNQFGNLASDEIKIVGIKAFQVLNSEGNPTIKCQFKVEYKLKIYNLVIDSQYQQASEESKVLFDQDEQGVKTKGMDKAIQLINEKIGKVLTNKLCSDQKNIDEQLNLFYEENGSECLNVTLPVSYAIPQIVAKIFHKQPFEVMREMTGFKISEDPKQNNPKLLINLLQGSKLVGVKCKVFKFYLIVKDYSSPSEAFEIAHQITHNIRKTITSGKQGEAALKFHTDGTFICSVDTIADNIKQIEEAIGKTTFKDNVALGISWMADNLYNAEKKNYELENPKQLFDVDQLIDYYHKLVHDKPIIEYMEDPIFSEDEEGWSKMINKFAETNIQIGSRFLYTNVQQIKDISEECIQENYPDLSPEELEIKNQQRVNLNAAFFKPYDFSTMSKFVEISKFLNQKACCTIISDNITDTSDTTIVDLAFSLNNVYLNMSSPSKYEKLLKYNRFVEILTLLQLQSQKQQQQQE